MNAKKLNFPVKDFPIRGGILTKKQRIKLVRDAMNKSENKTVKKNNNLEKLI